MLADKLHKRIEYVDILKGIGIICVLLGHNLVVQDDGQLPEIMRYIIYSFHMPLFFFLSGYVFSTKVNWTNFIKKKRRTKHWQNLYVKYVVISMKAKQHRLNVQSVMQNPTCSRK